VGKNDRVILYCRSGRRSGIAMNTLKTMGYSKAENVGGIEQARKALSIK
jgi:rhodanese-related sulfurtransferase